MSVKNVSLTFCRKLLPTPHSVSIATLKVSSKNNIHFICSDPVVRGLGLAPQDGPLAGFAWGCSCRGLTKAGRSKMASLTCLAVGGSCQLVGLETSVGTFISALCDLHFSSRPGRASSHRGPKAILHLGKRYKAPWCLKELPGPLEVAPYLRISHAFCQSKSQGLHTEDLLLPEVPCRIQLGTHTDTFNIA